MNADRRLRDGDFPAIQLLLAWVVVCAILLVAGASRVLSGQFPDPDDALRLVQVRDLLGGQSWFDLAQYRIAPPEGTPMHWSRLVDAPIALVIVALTPLVGQANAELAAMIAVPFLTFAIAAAAIGRLAWRLLGTRVAIFSVLACGFLPALLFEFRPMRIDHHGWQLASVALVLWAISLRDARKGGWLAGLAMAFGMSISLGSLPMAGAFGGVLFLRWWFDYRQRIWLVAYMQALALGLVAFYLVSHGFSLANYCDAISPSHLAFFAVAALGTSIIGSAIKLRGFALVLLFAGLAGASLAVFALASPECLASPFASLDPAVDRYWYRLVLEGQPLWKQAPSTYVPAMVQMAAAIGAVFVLRMRSHDWLRRWWSEHLLLLLAAVFLSLLVARSLALASIIAALPLGWLAASLLEKLRNSRALAVKVGSALAILVLLAPNAFVLGAGKFLPAGNVETTPMQSVAGAECAIYSEAKRLARLELGTIFAPLEIGPAVLLESDHAVVASGHHRAAEAMSDVIRAFMADPERARAIIASREADYLAMCTDMAEAGLYAREAPSGLAAELIRGKAPDWLEPVDIGGPPQLRLYRVAR